MTSIESTGKTIDDAILSGLNRLGLIRDEVDVKVLAEPKSGFLGFGSKPAVVRITPKETAHNFVAAVEKAAPVEDVKAASAPKASAKGAPVPAEPVQETPAAEAPKAEEPEVVEAKAAEKEEVVTEDAAAEATEDEKDEDPAFTAEDAAEKAKAFLIEVIHDMGMDVMIEKMIKPDKIILHLHGKNLGILIGKHGQTLDALQYLTNLTTNQGQGSRYFIMLDVENYRHRREETLRQLARRLAGQAKKSGKRVVLEPMNGYERKIIHVTLQNNEHIRTESEGQDPYRHVVIYYEA